MGANCPDSIRANINRGDEAYQITADLSPVFLYENPERYDPDDVLVGYMRGYFLVRVSSSSIYLVR